ncbi:MAG TPA: AMP-binding protein, partial [Micromonosporaceae bacterium]
MHPLTALRDAAAGTDPNDRLDAITIGDAATSRASLAEAASTLAERIAGAPAIAVRADATMTTVVAVVAGLLAGVPVVPLAADSGPDETDYMLADSGATLLIRDD